MLDINELETMLGPKTEFKASPTLKDKVIAEARNMAMNGSEPVRTEDGNDIKDIPHIVPLKPKIRPIYIIGVAAVAACVLLGFILFSHDDTESGTPQPAIAKVTPEKTIPQRSADTVRQVIDETDVPIVTTKTAHGQPLLAQHSTTVKEAVPMESEDGDDAIDIASLLPLVDTIPFVSTKMMDDCIAQLSAQYDVEPQVFECSDNQASGRTEMAYNFPDEKGNKIMSQLLKVACKYMEQNEDLTYIYSRNQFIMQLQNGRIDSPVVDTWQAERTNGHIIIYRTHHIGYNTASSACMVEYKERMM